MAVGAFFLFSNFHLSNSPDLQHLKPFMHHPFSTTSLKVKKSAAAEILRSCFLCRSEYVIEKSFFLFLFLKA